MNRLIIVFIFRVFSLNEMFVACVLHGRHLIHGKEKDYSPVFLLGEIWVPRRRLLFALGLRSLKSTLG